jgi:two-component system sensor histidine kinase DesK
MTRSIDTGDTRGHPRPSAWAWAGAVFGVLWVALPVVDLASSDPSAWQLALAGAGVPAFAAMFLYVVMTRRPLLVPLGAMLAIAVTLTLAAHDSFALLFVYAGSAAGVRLPGRANALAVAAITALAAGTLAVTEPDGALFWAVTSTVFATGTLWLLIGGLLRSNAALREARAELADVAVAEERLRFARDVHDLLGHDLSLIALKAELAGKLLPSRQDRAAAEIAEIRTLARSALTQVRQAVEGYRRPTLPGELAGARVALEAAGIELRVEGPPGSLDPEAESVLAWAVREGVTNVIRHSGAHHAAITLRPGPATTELEIADDGRGEPGSNGAAARDGHGLDGLRERADAIGGTVEVAPRPAGGFRLLVSVPARRGQVAA